MSKITPSLTPGGLGAAGSVTAGSVPSAELLKIATGSDARSPLNDILGKTYHLRSALEILISAHDDEIDPPEPGYVRSYCQLLMDVTGSIDETIANIDRLIRGLNAR